MVLEHTLSKGHWKSNIFELKETIKYQTEKKLVLVDFVLLQRHVLNADMLRAQRSLALSSTVLWLNRR